MHTLRTAVLMALLVPTLLHADPRDGQYEVYVSVEYDINLHGHFGHISPSLPDRSEVLERVITRLEAILDRWRNRWG